MIAVGIDVSKSKSTVAILDSYGTVLATPFNMAHTQPEMTALASRLKAFNEPVTILLEYTGHYHYPVLKKLQEEGFPVCVVNPYQMKKYGDVELHKAKTDKKDALRIATFALEKSYRLVPYSFMEQKYEDLKFLSDSTNKESLLLPNSRCSLLTFWIRQCPELRKFLSLKVENRKNVHYCSSLSVLSLSTKFSGLAKLVFSPPIQLL